MDKDINWYFSIIITFAIMYLYKYFLFCSTSEKQYVGMRPT